MNKFYIKKYCVVHGGSVQKNFKTLLEQVEFEKILLDLEINSKEYDEICLKYNIDKNKIRNKLIVCNRDECIKKYFQDKKNLKIQSNKHTVCERNHNVPVVCICKNFKDSNLNNCFGLENQ
jgi:hypothetical protein